jgi:hypothetical protein
MGTGKLADPNSEFSSAEQGIKNAEQGINNAHRRASFCVNEGAVCDAIAAIFAAFTPAMTMTGRVRVRIQPGRTRRRQPPPRHIYGIR